MGQNFFMSLYDAEQNKYKNKHFLLSKLGEIAMNKRQYWGYIKDRPLGIGFIGDENERYYRKSTKTVAGEHDYGIASKSLLFETDCAGELEFYNKLPPFEWTGYLVNHTQKLFFRVTDYYNRSNIKTHCLDPLAILTASNSCASLFFNSFTDGSAYSLLGDWFTDVIEWTEKEPTDMDEICDLEFSELYLQLMLNEWGLTSENYLADKNGKILYTRKDLGIFNIRISPAKQKYLCTINDCTYDIISEFEPDDGVVLSYQENKVLFKSLDGSAFEGFQEEWYGTAIVKTADGNKVPYAQWVAGR